MYCHHFQNDDARTGDSADMPRWQDTTRPALSEERIHAALQGNFSCQYSLELGSAIHESKQGLTRACVSAYYAKSC